MSYVVAPNRLQPGDVIEMNHAPYVVKYVDADRNSAYDVGLIDQQGNQRIEIITEPVTLLA